MKGFDVVSLAVMFVRQMFEHVSIGSQGQSSHGKSGTPSSFGFESILYASIKLVHDISLA